jgi:signal transduction histidine kinase/ActR/RegA family two-component response regulator
VAVPFVTESDLGGRVAAHLSRRAVAALAVGLGLLLVAALAIGLLAYRAVEAERWVDHTLGLREQARSVETTALVMQGSIRGYLLTENADFLEPYEQAARTLPEAVDQLVRLSADNPAQQAVIRDMRVDLDALVEAYREMRDATARDDRAAAIGLVGSGTGEALMAAVRQRLDSFAAEELRLLTARQATAQRLRLWTLLLVFGALLAASALVAVLSRGMLHYVNRLVLQSAELEKETRRRRESEATLVQVQKMEAVGQLAGGIAHDFNNMLTIILGNLSTALRRLGKDGEPPESVVQPLEAATQGARGAAKLTHRLLAFSRRQALAPSQIDLNRVVAGVTDLIRRSIGEGVEFETVLAAGLWPTFADAHQLENVLVNLVVNARDAMPEGGRVTIETANAYLDEAYAAGFGDVSAGQYVSLSVTDTGQGVPPELVGRVFEPFFTTKREGEGSGLGLAMTHGFVKQSGGHVRLYSELGQGTTVKIYLPRLAAAERPSAPAELPERAAAAVAGGSETILLVEDNEGVRSYARAALEEAGYAVVEAVDAEAALARLAEGVAVDLLFTDVVLGRGPSGRELADSIAARGIQLPVLFTTGYSRNAIVHNGRLDPGVDLLEKPYTQHELTRRVRTLLDRRLSGRGRNDAAVG